MFKEWQQTTGLKSQDPTKNLDNPSWWTQSACNSWHYWLTARDKTSISKHQNSDSSWVTYCNFFSSSGQDCYTGSPSIFVNNQMLHRRAAMSYFYHITNPSFICEDLNTVQQYTYQNVGHKTPSVSPLCKSVNCWFS